VGISAIVPQDSLGDLGLDAGEPAAQRLDRVTQGGDVHVGALFEVGDRSTLSL
jgi:hypothetical protein